jgi:hypothetical protein
LRAIAIGASCPSSISKELLGQKQSLLLREGAVAIEAEVRSGARAALAWLGDPCRAWLGTLGIRYAGRCNARAIHLNTRQGKLMRPDVALALDRLAAAARRETGLQPGAGERPFLHLWGSCLHALAEAALFLAGRLRASLHPTAEAGEAPAGEPPREPSALASPLAESPAALASPGTAMHALGKAGLGLVGCGWVLIRRCHRVGPLVVPAAEGSEGTVSIGRLRVPAGCATRELSAIRGTSAASLRQCSSLDV